ncbi:hypothetical protein [Haloparvum sedimenti]|nr:hypothetical protein [Haloparvum sedimenti]
MPCQKCGTGNVSGVCKECKLLARMEAEQESGMYAAPEEGEE